VNNSDAIEIVARLCAAYPWMTISAETVDVYVHHLVRLSDADAARTAIDVIIERDHRFPSVSAIRDTYAVARRWTSRRALPEPALTDAERVANVERIRGIASRVNRSIDMPPW